MEKANVELFGSAGNFAVIRLTGRAFPGVFMQGDTFSILVRHLTRMKELLGDLDDAAADELDGAIELSAAAIEFYEETLKRHGIDIPYSR